MAIFSTLSFAGPLLPSAQIMRVELFEHAGRGTVGENVRNLAKLPAILLPAHVHAAANQAVITPASGSRCHGSVAFQHCCLRFARVTPSSFSRGTVPRAMPSPNIESTTVVSRAHLGHLPVTRQHRSAAGRDGVCRAAMRAARRSAPKSVGYVRGPRGERPPVPYYRLQVTENGGLYLPVITAVITAL